MQAVFYIKASEIDASFIKKLKALFKDAVLEIGVNTERNNQADQRQTLNSSIQNIEKEENLIEFSGEEFNELVRKLSNK